MNKAILDLRAVIVAIVAALTLSVVAPVDGQEGAVGSGRPGDTTTVAEATALAEDSQLRWREIEILLEGYAEAEGDERLVIDAQILRMADDLRDGLASLTEVIVSLESRGMTAEEPKKIAGDMLTRVLATILDEHLSIEARVKELVFERSRVEPSQLAGLERRISRSHIELDEHFAIEVEFIGYLGALGLDAGPFAAELDRALDERAIRLSAELQVARRRIDELEEQLGRFGSESAELQAEMRGYRARFDSAVGSLTQTIEMMKDRGLQTAGLRQQLIRATGNITSDVLDAEVAAGLLGQSWKTFNLWMVKRLPQAAFNLLVFVLILVGFRFVAWLVGSMVDHAVTRSKNRMPQLLAKMARTVVRRALMLIGLLVALSFVGVQVGPILAGLGIIGFIVGFALQDTLANFASGMMIVMYRPFDLGDSIEAAGVRGRVHDLSLVSTTITTFDNRRVIVPNRNVWGDVICNVTAENTRRVDLEFSTGADEDSGRIEAFLREVAESHDLVLSEPPPVVQLDRMTEAGATWVVRPWVETADYWAVYWDVTRQVKDRFRAADVELPSPRREVSIRETTANPGATT